MERIFEVSDFDGFWVEESPEEDVLGTYLYSIKFNDETKEGLIKIENINN